jgi:predicted transcriptional regulator
MKMQSLLSLDAPASTLLATAGEALHGPEWANKLARDLGLNERTIRRLKAASLKGERHPVAPGVLDQAAALLRAKGRALTELADAMAVAAREIEKRPARLR